MRISRVNHHALRATTGAARKAVASGVARVRHRGSEAVARGVAIEIGAEVLMGARPAREGVSGNQVRAGPARSVNFARSGLSRRACRW